MKPLSIQPPTSSSEVQDWLTSREVCSRYRLSPSFLSALRVKGEGPAFHRLGHRKVLYEKSAVESWLASLINRSAC
jgi:predicted DNA-binding transcriptional regulator AlpA